MPNWCVTNWKLRGEEETLQQFCDIVNSLPNREDYAENGFGKYWLANLANALGLDVNKMREHHDNLRGTIECNAELASSLAFPGSEKQDKYEVYMTIDVDDEKEAKKYYCLEFSTASAWDMPYWLEDYFTGHGIEYGFFSTDEFRGFNVVCNTSLMPYVYECGGPSIYDEFKLGQEDKVVEFIREQSGIDLSEKCDITDSKSLAEAVEKHAEELAEKDCYVLVYDIVEP